MNPDNEPDIFDLNDWLVTERPEVYAAIKYLHAEHFAACARQVWELAGRPDIR